MFCKVCNKPMKHIMRFENGKSYELFQCPHCYWESKKTTLKFPITKTEQLEKKQKVPAKPKRRGYYGKREQKQKRS